MLQQGGNAVDAAVAAAFVTFIAEYTVSATGGGGFALVYDAKKAQGNLYDFFSAAPGLDRDTPPDPAQIDFAQITIDYGVSQQYFHVGRGSMAVPGNVAGLCALAQQEGRLPLPILLEPAIHLAREGCQVSEMQHFISLMLEPIFLRTPSSRAVFAREDGRELLGPGETLRMPDLANTLEALALEGPRLFYAGDVAQAIVKDQEARGGLITRTDLERYRVRRRQPLARGFRGRTVLTNPPPSRGGLLISFSLGLLDRFRLRPADHGNVCHLELIAEVMRVTNLARRELEQQNLQPRQQVARLLGTATIERWAETLKTVLGQPVANRPGDSVMVGHASTTQISVIDEDGLAISMTTSGGEGAGFIVPGTGIVPNNMLGEEDLHPQGFHKLEPGRRIPSMMSPTVVLDDAGWPVLALGSGGANRIRSAILQVLLNRLEFGLALEESVEASRVHWEEGVLQVEAGNDPQVVDQLQAMGYVVNRWSQRHMFFGGAHSVARNNRDQLVGAGDSRRGGCAQVVGDAAS
jgi:gamma-glutamyltranspeptidase/glutathione hydrolase